MRGRTSAQRVCVRHSGLIKTHQFPRHHHFCLHPVVLHHNIPPQLGQTPPHPRHRQKASSPLFIFCSILLRPQILRVSSSGPIIILLLFVVFSDNYIIKYWVNFIILSWDNCIIMFWDAYIILFRYNFIIVFWYTYIIMYCYILRWLYHYVLK